MTPSKLAVLGALAAAGVAAAVILLRRYRPRSPLDRLTRQARRDRSTSPSSAPVVTARVDRAPILTRVLEGTSVWEELQMEILRAGVLLKPSELVAMIILAALAGSVIGLVLGHGPFGAIGGGLLGAALPWIWIKARQAKRLRDLTAQLPDAIDMLSTAMRTGFSFLRGVQLIASQMQPPISEEFRRVATEVQLGMSVDEALDNLVDRTRCYDLELLVAAVQIQLNVGGNLSEILDSISHTIRERVRLQGEIMAATAETRLSSVVLLAMPVGVALLINAVNPGYLKPLFTTPVGMGMALLAGVLMAIGALVIRKIADVDL